MKPTEWSFGGKTPMMFSEHVRKSIPFYEEGHALIEAISDYFITSGTVYYDLGTSVGELPIRIANRHSGKGRFIGIDTMPEMIAVAKDLGKDICEFVVGDILTYLYEKSDFITAYYCLQFIHPKDRLKVVSRIYDSLNPGGAFVMFEKVLSCDARFNEIVCDIYYDMKEKNGFSAEEILEKRRSLKGVMSPISSAANEEMLKKAGFSSVMSIMKYVCFEGFLSIK